MTTPSQAFFWTGIGSLFGLLLALHQRHPRRLLGIVPLAVTGVFLLALLLAVWPVPALYLLAGVAAGMLPLPLTCLLLAEPPQGNGRLKNAWLAVPLVFGIALALILALSARALESGGLGYHWIIASLAAVGTASSCYFLRIPALELLLEIFIWPLYRIRAEGPGIETLPRRGPLLIIANHSSWMDPIWLGKVMPRRLFPMMTSLFYDLPILRWWMINVIEAIRVQTSTFRREVPEIKEAVAYLDQGRCVVIFPEGRLRRDEDKPLSRFGQGVCQILKQRPDTPVIVCWIEGGWGSFFSYAKGPPTKNKSFDRWHSVRIAVDQAEVLDKEMLDNAAALRRYLMQRCLEARKHLGLEPLTAPWLLPETPEPATDQPAANMADLGR